MYVLSHDLGTSGDKACLFDAAGKLIRFAFTPYETYFPASGWAEQDPDEWWAAVCGSSRQVLREASVRPEDVIAISFSAQSSGCLPVDERGRALRERAIIWMDTRSGAEAEELTAKLGPDTQYNITGNGLAAPMLPCCKIMWMKKHEPLVWERVYKFLGCKEALIARMTGEVGLTDYTEAQASGLFSALDRDYDPRLLSAAGIPREKLCKPAESVHCVGTVLPEAAEALGVSAKTRVILGMMDNPSAAVGAGCLESGVFVASLGTAAWLGCVSDRTFTDARYHVNSTYIGFGKYRSSVNSHTVGAAFDWALKNLLGLSGENLPGQAAKLAANAPAGASGLMFLPSFRIGNCRYCSPGASGALLGMKLEHDSTHIARALFESLAFELKIGMEFFENADSVPKEIRVVGGGSKNELQCQIIADVLGIPVTAPQNSRHIGAFGAAAFALAGAGLGKGVENAAWLVPERVYQPDRRNTAAYAGCYQAYKACYEALIPLYDQKGG